MSGLPTVFDDGWDNPRCPFQFAPDQFRFPQYLAAELLDYYFAKCAEMEPEGGKDG